MTQKSGSADELNLATSTVPEIVWAIDVRARARIRESAGPHCSVAALWTCPVCETSVPRMRRAGRDRVYCTNACRQKAYRHRRKQRTSRRFADIIDPRPSRATTRDRSHAIRDFADVSTGRRDSVGKGVTVCGVFARMSIDRPNHFGHTRFHAPSEHARATTCRRCEILSGVVDRFDLAQHSAGG